MSHNTGPEHNEELIGEGQVVRDRLLAWTRSAEKYYDGHGFVIFVLLVTLFSVWAWVSSQAKALWFDELLGLAASSASSLQGVFSALAKPVDINPPVYHLLARLSIALLGYSALAARLPAFLGMLVFLLSLFVFISRRLSPSYGVLGALLILCTQVSIYAWDARPYAILLGLTGLAMLSYQRRSERGDLISLIVFVLCCCCLPLTHYYGILVIGPFLTAEVARSIERKRIDWRLLIGLAMGLSATLFLLRNLIRSQRSILAHYHSQGSLRSFATGSDLTFSGPMWAVSIAIAALAFGCWLGKSGQLKGTGATRSGFSGPELVLAASLLSLPFLGAMLTTLTHAYTNRYFIAASAGYAILVCYLAESFQGRCVGAALFLSMVGMMVIVYDLGSSLRHRHDRHALASLQPLLATLNLPVVFQDAKDYVVARELNSDIRGRFYYAAEPELAVKMTGTDTDDRLMLALASVQPEQVTRLDDMARQSEYWIVVPASFGWLVPCLTRMRVDMQPVHFEATDGKSALSGFRVRLPMRGSRPLLWCEASPSTMPQPTLRIPNVPPMVKTPTSGK